jgi:hypothetical protein
MMGVVCIIIFTPTQGVSLGHEAWIYIPRVQSSTPYIIG